MFMLLRLPNALTSVILWGLATEGKFTHSFTRFRSVRQLIQALKLGFNVLSLAPLLALLLPFKYNIWQFSMCAKRSICQSRHSRWHILFTYCVFTVCLSKSLIIFIHGKHLTLPAQGTNSKDGIRALTITTINFIMVALTPPRWKFVVFSFWLAQSLCMPKSQPKQKSKQNVVSFPAVKVGALVLFSFF